MPAGIGVSLVNLFIGLAPNIVIHIKMQFAAAKPTVKAEYPAIQNGAKSSFVN
ncbi:MAG: hypothetical protein ACYCZR_07480 [Burkholderiales bacterium]